MKEDMSNKLGNMPLGKSEKFDVALQRPTVNIKEAENVGEQVQAVLRQNDSTVRFGRHGTFSQPKPNPIEQE